MLARALDKELTPDKVVMRTGTDDADHPIGSGLSPAQLPAALVGAYLKRYGLGRPAAPTAQTRVDRCTEMNVLRTI